MPKTRKPYKQQICGKSEGKMYKCGCLPSNGLLCEDCYEKGGHSKHEGSNHSDAYHGWCDCGNHYYINRESCCPEHVIPNGGTCGNRRGKKFKCSCAKQSNALLCEHCSKKHTGHGHTLTEYDSWWGTCDCGSKYYFDKDHFCNDHPGYAMLTGRCWYKSGFVEQKGHGVSAAWGSKHNRWFQCRHSEMYYYTKEQDGYNWADPGCPKDDDEGAKGLSLHLPSISMSLPNLPSIHLPSMPSLSMPSLSMPSLSMPSLSMPSLKAPSLGSLKRKKRQEDPLGFFRLAGVKVKQDGKTVTLTNVTYDRYYENNQTETIKNAKFVLITPSEEQADSWVETLVYGGAVED